MNPLVLDEQKRNILNKIKAGVLYCKNDSYSTILYANDYFYSIVGYTRSEVEELFQNRFASLVISDVSQILKAVSQCIAKGEDLDFEYRMRHKDGRILYIHDTASYDKVNDCWYVTIMDISAMKTAEYERQKLNLYLHHVPNKILISDGNGQIVFVNEAAQNCLYLDKQERNLFELMRSRLTLDDFSLMQQWLNQRQSFSYETHVQQGGRYVNHDLNYVVPIYDKHDNILNFMHISVDLLPQGDVLTSFPSRSMFERYYQKTTEYAPNAPLYLGILDIDDFKKINDQYGHHVGDQAIVFTAQLLAQTVGEKDYLCRFGGDEFLMMMINCTPEQVQQRMNHIAQCVKNPVQIGEHEIQLSYSIGVAFNHRQPVPYLELNKKADQALYTLKHGAKGGLHLV